MEEGKTRSEADNEEGGRVGAPAVGSVLYLGGSRPSEWTGGGQCQDVLAEALASTACTFLWPRHSHVQRRDPMSSRADASPTRPPPSSAHRAAPMSKSWFDHAFGSRADAELLLRPDLESGLLSQHDYALAVDFLPGPVRYLPVRLPPPQRRPLS